MAGRKDIHKDGQATQFKKGESGNPDGRPKGVQNSKTRLLRFLSLQMKGKNPVTKAEEEFSVLEMGDLKQIEKMLGGDIQAYREILDRLEGKSAQKNELSGPDGNPIEVKQWIIEVQPQQERTEYDPSKTSA